MNPRNPNGFKLLKCKKDLAKKYKNWMEQREIPSRALS